MLAQLKERLAKFKLVVQEKKTRLIGFGNLATKLREQRGAGRRETFNFIGFRHHFARSLDGRLGKRPTDCRRLVRKLNHRRDRRPPGAFRCPSPAS